MPKNTSDRDELLGGFSSHGDDNGGNDFDASTMDQRQRLLSGTERLGQSSRRLEESHRLALETEGIGINILSTLKGQRETMLRARDTVSYIGLMLCCVFYSFMFLCSLQWPILILIKHRKHLEEWRDGIY